MNVNVVFMAVLLLVGLVAVMLMERHIGDGDRSHSEAPLRIGQLHTRFFGYH